MKIASIILIALALSGCWSSRNDGAGNLWRIPACIERGAC